MTREEAISCIKQIKFRGYLRGANPFYEQDTEAIEMAIKALSQEPTTTQNSGKWIPHSSGIWIEYYECSECGRGHTIHSDYCPNCGAKMESEEQTE